MTNGPPRPKQETAASRPVVVGLGNLLMGDEGIGVRIAQLLQEQFPELPADVHEIGTGTGGLLGLLQNRRLAVIVDCAYMETEPGKMVWFTPEQVRDRKQQFRWSLHHGSVLESLELARRLGCAPERTLIAGIQPHTVKPGIGLSPELESRLEDYAREVAGKLRSEVDS